jgi:acetyltransferase-like isoleucine patch superfamily enzyme
VVVGERVFFDAASVPIELYAWAGAVIFLGDDVYVGGGTSIEATRSIVIARGARVGAFCKVMDCHFHPLVGDRHCRPAPHPVVIDEGAILGPRTIVMAGARVERGARVAAGAVVRRTLDCTSVEMAR